MRLSENDLMDQLILLGYRYCYETGRCFNDNDAAVGENEKQIYYRFSKKIGDRKYYIRNHRFAFYYHHKFLPKVIDHIDRNTKNNKIDNLRDGSGSVNIRNTKRVAQAKGYRFAKHANMWVASIRINYKNIHLGYFKDESDARKAYLNAAQLTNDSVI